MAQTREALLQAKESLEGRAGFLPAGHLQMYSNRCPVSTRGGTWAFPEREENSGSMASVENWAVLFPDLWCFPMEKGVLFPKHGVPLTTEECMLAALFPLVTKRATPCP